jgi:hypothetical protein
MSEEQKEVVEQKTDVQAQAEKEARLMGWVPKEEFRDGEHWVDAETFVKRGKEINPILRKNNETLLKKLEAAEKEVAAVKQAAEEFKAFQKENAERKVKELEKQLLDLKEQKKTAISQADGEAVVAIDEAIDAIKEEQQAAKKPPKEEKPEVKEVALDPIITTWMDDNKWFGDDQKYTRVADAIGASISQEFPNLKGKAFFEKLDGELQEVLPEKYKKKSGRPNPVEGAASTPSRPVGGKKQTYDNLPSDAKEACNRFVKQGFMTREQYVADYDWD